MSGQAELLRAAAKSMREKATAAVASLSDNVPEWHSVDALMGEGKTRGDAAHIVAWHPAVALAVADWLDHVAARVESKIAHGGGEAAVWSHEKDALKVAAAYLGRDA